MLPIRVRNGLALAVLTLAAISSACLVRRRTVAPLGKHENRPILTATKDELIRRIHAITDPVQSFTMKVDMSPSVGSLYLGQVTDYPTFSGYILYQKPDEIRVIGLDPVVHSTILDMVSIGNDFRVSIPTKNQFIEGANDAPAHSKNKLENLRPVAFLTSLMIPAPDPKTDAAILVDDTNETKSIYILMAIQHNGDELRLVRNVYFDRFTLAISRQKRFDAAGNITSDTKYSDWKTWGVVQFPSTIDIQRPQDGYELVLKVTDLKPNTSDMPAEKFKLEPPPNAQIRSLK